MLKCPYWRKSPRAPTRRALYPSIAQLHTNPPVELWAPDATSTSTWLMAASFWPWRRIAILAVRRLIPGEVGQFDIAYLSKRPSATRGIGARS